MDSNDISMNIEEGSYQKNIKSDIRKINSKYIIKEVFDFLEQRILLKTIKYNKKIQNDLNISLKDYKNYSDIEIDIIPADIEFEDEDDRRIINFNNKEEAKYFHIYYNDKNNREIKREKKIILQKK